ncbi:MAG: YjjG family noncanonical pyrimidine nucleotidase [Woeseiaceae bacterium]|jgi:2-haloacid dehalogenase
MRYKTFLLDLDHTLFDSDASEAMAFSRAMTAAGVAEPGRYAAAYRKINLELWAAVERGEITPQGVRTHRFERLVAEYDLDADPDKMADDFVAGLGAHGDLYDGALEVLKRLSAEVSLAMVTNGLGEVQRSRIGRLGIDEYFDAIVISAEVGASKPGTAIFDIVFDALGFPAKETAVMVGDNLSSDIEGGANYGIATCWYNPGGRPSRQSGQPVHEIAALEELLGLVIP